MTPLTRPIRLPASWRRSAPSSKAWRSRRVPLLPPPAPPLAGLTKSFLDLAESTRKYREDHAKLDAAFTTAGFTAEQAGEAYTGFYAILGEEDRSVEAVNHLAKLCSTEEELAQWTDIAAGVWATFGDSLPIEGLTEAANETAKTGTITGQLADALNWAGGNEEAFQSALDGCSSEQERAALITDTLNGLYQEAAENYKTLNGDVMEAQRAQALLTDAYAQLGAIAEPIMTTLKTMAADVLTAMIPFVSLMGEGLQGVLNGTAVAAETFAEGISGLVSVLMEKLSTIVPVIGEAILASLPVLLEAGVNIIATLVTGIVNALPKLAAAALSIVLQLVTSLTELAPQLLQAAMQVVATLASGIASALPQLVPTIVQMVVQICQTLIANLPLILDAALQLVTGLAQGILNALPVLIAALPEIINGIVTFLLDAIPQIIETGIQLLTSLVAALPDIIAAIVAAIPQIIEGIITAVLNSIPQIIQAGIDLLVSLIQALPQIITTIVAAIPQIITGIVNALINSIPQIIQAGVELLVSPDCESPDHHCGDREGNPADHHGDRFGPRSGRFQDRRGGRQPGARPVAGHPVTGRMDLGQSVRLDLRHLGRYPGLLRHQLAFQRNGLGGRNAGGGPCRFHCGQRRSGGESRRGHEQGHQRGHAGPRQGYDHGAAHRFLREGQHGKRHGLRCFRRRWEERLRPAAEHRHLQQLYQ